MATYGRYDVTRYPNSYAVTDMVTHNVLWRSKTDSDSAQLKAHRRAKALQTALQNGRSARKKKVEVGGEQCVAGAARIGRAMKLHRAYRRQNGAIHFFCSCRGTVNGAAGNKAHFYAGVEGTCKG